MKNSVLIPAVTAVVVSIATTATVLHFKCNDRPCPSRFDNPHYSKMKHSYHKKHKARMMRADTDKDGNLTKEEMVNAAIARFEKLDTNKDGKVSKDEFKKAAKKFKRSWKGKDGNRLGKPSTDRSDDD